MLTRSEPAPGVLAWHVARIFLIVKEEAGERTESAGPGKSPRAGTCHASWYRELGTERL